MVNSHRISEEAFAVTIDLVAERLGRRTRGAGEVVSGRSVQNTPACVDECHRAAPATSIADRLTQIASLRADAGDQYRHLRDDRADRLQLLWPCRADDKTAVSPCIPLLHLADHVLVEWSLARAKVLEIFCPRIRGQRQDEDAAPGITEEWFDGVRSHVGVHRAGGEVELLKQCPRVKLRGVPDISPFRVPDGDDVRRNSC